MTSEPGSLLGQVLRHGDSLMADRDSDGRRYWQENRRRIATAVVRAIELARTSPASDGPVKVLDVGPSLEVELLAAFLPDAELATMGWADHRYQASNLRRHHAFDLNDAVDPARWPQTGAHDLILLLEVIEHLHVAPSHVFKYLRGCLRPGGHLLVSTPNAAWLRHRWRLLMGRNPYEPIREDSRNPGHFRELTRDELCAMLEGAGFRVVSCRIESLYCFSSASGRRFSRMAEFLPQTFRHDMWCTAVRTE